MSYYLHLWILLTSRSFQISFISRLGAFLFTLGKILRFVLFMLIVILVVTKTKTLVGYTLNQSLIFFLTYNIIDTLTQLLFRDVYRFRPQVLSGSFDYTLLKPWNPLFRVLFGGADPLDLIMLIPYVILLVVFIMQLEITFITFMTFIILILNALLIATSFHIFVLGLGIITTEVDHTIMIYRDITSMARFPVDIYQEPLRGFITYIIPIGIMMTFPPKALFGLLSWQWILVSGVLGLIIFKISLSFWQYALKQYTSASS